MVTVFSDNPRTLDVVRAALPHQHPSRCASSWPELENLAPHAAVFVVAMRRLEPEDVQPLAQLREKHPLQPIVLVTERQSEVARLLRSMTLDEIVWYDEVAHQLAPAIARAVCERFFHELAALIHRNSRVTPTLRVALARAALQAQPVRSVRRLGVLAGRHPATLWRQWRAAVLDRCLRLEDCLDWCILLRALQRKWPERSWYAVAESLAVDPRRLRRISRRLAGVSLRELEIRGFAHATHICLSRFDRALSCD